MFWENTGDWKSQYTPAINTYIGSADDGGDDPQIGYAPYDFDTRPTTGSAKTCRVVRSKSEPGPRIQNLSPASAMLRIAQVHASRVLQVGHSFRGLLRTFDVCLIQNMPDIDVRDQQRTLEYIVELCMSCIARKASCTTIGKEAPTVPSMTVAGIQKRWELLSHVLCVLQPFSIFCDLCTTMNHGNKSFVTKHDEFQ